MSPPGKPVKDEYDSKNLELGATVSKLDDPVARKNFRVVIIVPDSVEQTDLRDPAKARRFRYTLEESGWKKEELWP